MLQLKSSNKKDKTFQHPERGRIILGGVIGLVVTAAVALSVPSFAQDPGLAAWDRGGCSTCHGAVADGGGGDAEPEGPSLRRTELNRELLIETISCGRPGAAMPYHLIGAYTKTPCYGLPVGDVPAEVNGAGIFTAEEAAALVDFLLKHVVGKTKVTREGCAVFFGGDKNAIDCRYFR